MTVQPPEPLSLAELIARGPGATTSPEQERPFIGVPPGYVIQREQAPIRLEGRGWWDRPPLATEPLYRDGDEYLPAQDSAENRARLQKMMFDLGILDQDFQVGVWDTPTRLAYRSVLEFANGAGITADDALRQYGNVLDAADAKQKRQPLVVRKSNPDDLRRVFQQAASQALGERAPDEEIDRMVAAYQAQEASFSRQAWDATYEGGTVTEPPSPEAFAMDTLEEQHPIETEAYRGADQVMAAFADLIEGPFGG